MTSTKILMLIALASLILLVVSEVRETKRINNYEKALQLIGKRGQFKFDGKMIEGKVILVHSDRLFPIVTIEVDGEEEWYTIYANKFKPFDEEDTE